MYGQPRSANDAMPLQVPCRVRAAQDYLHFAQSLRAMHLHSQGPTLPGDSPKEIELVSLTSKEQATYDAALEVLIRYFNGEMDYGDSPPTISGGGPDNDEPKNPVPVPI